MKMTLIDPREQDGRPDVKIRHVPAVGDAGPHWEVWLSQHVVEGCLSGATRVMLSINADKSVLGISAGHPRDAYRTSPVKCPTSVRDMCMVKIPRSVGLSVTSQDPIPCDWDPKTEGISIEVTVPA